MYHDSDTHQKIGNVSKWVSPITNIHAIRFIFLIYKVCSAPKIKWTEWLIKTSDISDDVIEQNYESAREFFDDESWQQVLTIG